MRRIFQFKKNISPRGKFYWRSLVDDWKRFWLLTGKYCISNKAKETHFKIWHKIYPVNFNVSTYLDIDSSCSFCKQAEESLEHLFLECPISKQFWSDLGSHIFDSYNVVHFFSLNDIIFYYDNTKNKPLEHTLNYFYMVIFSFTNKKLQIVTHPIPFLK